MIRLTDGKPWFRRWLWVGYRPITAEGRILIWSAAAICLLAGVIVLLTDGQGPLTVAALATAIAVAIGANAIALFKVEDNF